ncbi:MAG: hypothetical protein ACLUE2_06990 [Bacteroides cellulosilyticus]
MKYIICILISFTFSALCLSQNELKVDVSYLKEKQFLLIKVKTKVAANHLDYLMVVLARMSLMAVLFTLGKARKVLFLMTRCF